MKFPKFKIIKLFAKFDIALFTDVKELNKFLKLKNQSDLIVSDNNFIGRTLSFFDCGVPVYVMYINIDRYEIGTTIHESTHIIDFLMMDIGINDIEFRAYMIEDLSVRLIEYFRKEQDGNLCKKSD